MSSKKLTAQEIQDIIRDKNIPTEEKRKIVDREIKKIIEYGRSYEKDVKKQ